jgi:hypothetical protein
LLEKVGSQVRSKKCGCVRTRKKQQWRQDVLLMVELHLDGRYRVGNDHEWQVDDLKVRIWAEKLKKKKSEKFGE